MNLDRLRYIVDITITSIKANPFDAFIEDTCITELKNICGEYFFPYYRLFQLLGFSLGNPIAIELGVDKGRGCRALISGGAIVFGVEEQAKECFVLPSIKNLTFIKASSTPVPKEIQDAGEIDIIHFDTEHTYSQVAAEFKAYKPFLKDGCVMCFDDTHAAEDEVLKFVNELPYEKIHEDRLHPGCGYSVVIYRKDA